MLRLCRRCLWRAGLAGLVAGVLLTLALVWSVSPLPLGLAGPAPVYLDAVTFEELAGEIDARHVVAARWVDLLAGPAGLAMLEYCARLDWPALPGGECGR